MLSHRPARQTCRPMYDVTAGDFCRRPNFEIDTDELPTDVTGAAVRRTSRIRSRQMDSFLRVVDSRTVDTCMQQNTLEGLGRVMRSSRPEQTGAMLLCEAPVARGACCVHGCPACPGNGKGVGGECKGAGCSWARAAAQPYFAPAVEAHKQMSAAALDDDDETSSESAKAACCVLVILVQALEDPGLARWVMAELRPPELWSPELRPSEPVEEGSHAASARRLAIKFGELLPPRAASGPTEPSDWIAHLHGLLIRSEP